MLFKTQLNKLVLQKAGYQFDNRSFMYRMYGIRGCMDAKERACTGCTVFAVAWMQKSVHVQDVRYSRLHGCKRALR